MKKGILSSLFFIFWFYAIAIDSQGNNWIGTLCCGLAKFDGSNWTVYNFSNSGLPGDYVRAIAIDSQGPIHLFP